MRQCGDCQLCCKLLPVSSLNKGANTRCKHQRHHKGCAVYANLPNVAPECRLWSCQWLVAPNTTANIRRPDRAGYVIDTFPDFVTALDNDTGKSVRVPVIQIWCDPKQPDAWRDPALKDFLLRYGAKGHAAIIRFDAYKATAVIPPNMGANGEWREFPADANNSQLEETHSVAELLEVLYETAHSSR